LTVKEEEIKASMASSWEENGHRHELIDNLEKRIEMLQQDSIAKDIEFEKELVFKNKTIKKLEKKNGNILKQLEAEFTEDAKDEKNTTVVVDSSSASQIETIKKKIIEEVNDTPPSKDEPCNVCKKAVEHSGDCSVLKKLLEDYIPVKTNNYPMMPFPYQVNQQAIKRYMAIFGDHRCRECRELELEDIQMMSVPYCKNHYIQLVLLNAEYTEGS
jgi:hypothetical protein